MFLYKSLIELENKTNPKEYPSIKQQIGNSIKYPPLINTENTGGIQTKIVDNIIATKQPDAKVYEKQILFLFLITKSYFAGALEIDSFI